MHLIKKRDAEEFIRDFLYEVTDKACAFGESLKINKEIQAKFQKRPVDKHVFIKLKNLE